MMAGEKGEISTLGARGFGMVNAEGDKNISALIILVLYLKLDYVDDILSRELKGINAVEKERRQNNLATFPVYAAAFCSDPPRSILYGSLTFSTVPHRQFFSQHDSKDTKD